MNNYVVLNNMGEDCGFEQQTIMLSKKDAIRSYNHLKERHPDRYYYVAKILSEKELEQYEQRF